MFIHVYTILRPLYTIYSIYGKMVDGRSWMMDLIALHDTKKLCNKLQDYLPLEAHN